MKTIFSILFGCLLAINYVFAQTPFDSFAPELKDKRMLKLPETNYRVYNPNVNDSVEFIELDEDRLILSFFSSENSVIRAVQLNPLALKWWSIDRFAEKYPSHSPYHYALNNPILNIDINGDSAWTINNQWNADYIQGYIDFVGTQAQQYIKNGDSYTCEDFSLSLLIDYASQNGLPVTIVNGEGTFDARSDNYTDMATFKNDVLTFTGARDLQNSANAYGIDINSATTGDIILNRYQDNNIARHAQVVLSPTNDIGVMGIVQGNSGVMNKVPGASRIFDAGNPQSMFYTGQHIEKAIYIPAADFYKNYSTGSTYSNYSHVRNIDIRRWNFKRF